MQQGFTNDPDGQQGERSAARIRPPRMRTISDAAKETGLSYNCIRRLCMNGNVAHVKTGRKIFINLDALIDYCATNRD